MSALTAGCYCYGLDLISQIDGAGNDEYFLYDGLGSTRQLADNSGDVVATYEYDALGALRSKTGAADTAFRFTGEQWDSESGFYYLRARYYDPAIGRFVSQDPLMGFASAPQTLNRYAYVLNNPVNWIDPWGLRNLEGTAFATPTPTPVGAIVVCGPARQAECLNRQFVVPPSGWGIGWGTVVRAYWEYHPYHLTYRFAQHVLPPVWDALTSSCALSIERATAGFAVTAVGLAARNPLWTQTGGVVVAVNVMNAAQYCR